MSKTTERSCRSGRNACSSRPIKATHRNRASHQRQFAPHDSRRQQQTRRAPHFRANQMPGHCTRKLRRRSRQQIGTGRRASRNDCARSAPPCSERIARVRLRRVRHAFRGDVRGFRQPRRFVVVHVENDAGNVAEPGGDGGGQPFPPGDQAMGTVALLDQQRLQHAVALDRLDQCRRRIGQQRRIDRLNRASTRSRPVEEREASRST